MLYKLLYVLLVVCYIWKLYQKEVAKKMCGRNLSLSILEAVNGYGRGGAASRCIWRGDHELKLWTGNQIL